MVILSGLEEGYEPTWGLLDSAPTAKENHAQKPLFMGERGACKHEEGHACTCPLYAHKKGTIGLNIEPKMGHQNLA